MIVPQALYEKFLYTKYTSDIVSTGLIQKFVKALIASGAYRAYVAQTRQRMEERKSRAVICTVCPIPTFAFDFAPVGLQPLGQITAPDRPAPRALAPWRGVFVFSPV